MVVVEAGLIGAVSQAIGLLIGAGLSLVLIYVIEGQVEQWLEQTSQILNPGDSVFIPKDIVHASFNTSANPAKLLAILAPCVTEAGYVSVEVGDQEPWKSLR